MTALILTVALAAAGAQAPKPIVRAQIVPAGPVLVGQQVTLTVDVLVPTFFTSAPKWPSLDIPGAVVTLPEAMEVNLTETIDGVSYAGIRQTYQIVAQREGELSLPPATIAFKYPVQPGQPSVDATVTIPSTTFTVKLPAGATSAAGPITVAKVSVTQSLDRDLQGLKAGDSLVRTVDVFAEHTQAMLIPPPAFDAPPGVRVYPADPVLTDETKDRVGFVGGRRVDRVTYVFERAGDVTLPAIAIQSFDAAAGKAQTATAPEIHLSIAANTAARDGIAPDPPDVVTATAPRPDRRGEMAWLLAFVLASGAAVWIVLRAYPVAAGAIEARRRAHAGSADAFASRVRHACAANDARQAYAALLRWRAHPDAAPGPDAALDAERRDLERALFSREPLAASWKGGRLAQALSDVRKAASRRQHAAAERRPALPELNT